MHYSFSPPDFRPESLWLFRTHSEIRNSQSTIRNSQSAMVLRLPFTRLPFTIYAIPDPSRRL